MASIHRTQLRLQQVTGSLGLGGMIDTDGIAANVTATGSLNLSHAGQAMAYIANAVGKIHGAPDFNQAARGSFYQDLLVGATDGTNKVQFRDGDIFIQSSVDGQLDLQADGEIELTTAKLDVDASSDFNIAGGAASLLTTSAGNLSVDAAAANLILDGHTGVDIDASNSGKVSIDGAGGIDIGVAADVAIDMNSSTLDIDASGAITMDSTSTIVISGDAGASIGDDTEALAFDGSGNVDFDAVQLDIDASDWIKIDAADEIEISTTSADGHINLASAHTAGLAVYISGSAHASSEVKIDAGILDLNAVGAATIDAASFTLTADDVVFQSAASDKPDVVIKNTNDDATGPSLALTLDTSNSAADDDIAGTISFNADDAGNNQTEYARIQTLANSVTAGSESGKLGFSVATTTSGAITEVMSIVGGANAVGSTVTIEGDLQVRGTTVTLDTENLLVEDPIIVLNKANSSANGQGGIAIEQGGTSLDMVIGRVANDTWGVGTKDTSGGTAVTVADMTLGAFRAGKLEIDSANDHIDVSTDLTITAAADIKLAPGGGQVVPNANNTVGLGIKSSAEFADLYLGQDAEIGFNNDNLKLVHQNASNSLLLSSSLGKLEFNDSKVSIATSAADTLVLRSDNLDYIMPVSASYVVNGVLTDVAGNGQLSFAAVNLGARNSNTAASIPAQSSGVPEESQLSNYVGSSMNFNFDAAITNAELVNCANVFVNGQMLLSGSSSEVTAGTADYEFVPDGSSAEMTITVQANGAGAAGLNNLTSNAANGVSFPAIDAPDQHVILQQAGGNATRSSGGAQGTNSVVMNANITTSMNPGDIVEFTDGSSNKHRMSITGVSSATVNFAQNLPQAIPAGATLTKVGSELELRFFDEAGSVSGDISGGRIKVGVNNATIGYAGNDATKNAIADQIVTAITLGTEKLDAVRGASAGQVIVTQALSHTNADAGGLRAPILNNFSNTPLAATASANGAVSGRRSLKLSFALEPDDVIQVLTR